MCHEYEVPANGTLIQRKDVRVTWTFQNCRIVPDNDLIQVKVSFVDSCACNGMLKKPSNQAHPAATREDFQRILGELDDPKIISVLELRPTVEDLEEAAICLTGDHDVLAKSGHHVSAVASQVVEILTEDEEERRGE